MSIIKDRLRQLMVRLPFKITTNQWYDHLTIKIIDKILQKDSNGIDIGCHKGEVMDILLQKCSDGHHFGFEPIPYLYDMLTEKYSDQRVTILPYALSNEVSKATFNHVLNHPAYSGLNQRKYDHDDVIIEEIEVEVARLDDCIPENHPIHFIKIDVEGGELGVLEGGRNLIKKNKPLIIFEHGMGASEYYGNTPELIFEFFEKLNYNIFNLSNVVSKLKPLNHEEFSKQFYKQLNYYFGAVPKT